MNLRSRKVATADDQATAEPSHGAPSQSRNLETTSPPTTTEEPRETDQDSASFKRHVRSMKLLKIRHHVTFLQSCAAEGLVPKGMRLKLRLNVMEPSDNVEKSVEEVLTMAAREVRDLVLTHYTSLQRKFEREIDEDTPTDESVAIETELEEKQSEYAARLAARRQTKLEVLRSPPPADTEERRRPRSERSAGQRGKRARRRRQTNFKKKHDTASNLQATTTTTGRPPTRRNDGRAPRDARARAPHTRPTMQAPRNYPHTIANPAFSFPPMYAHNPPPFPLYPPQIPHHPPPPHPIPPQPYRIHPQSILPPPQVFRPAPLPHVPPSSRLQPHHQAPGPSYQPPASIPWQPSYPTTHGLAGPWPGHVPGTGLLPQPGPSTQPLLPPQCPPGTHPHHVSLWRA